jgi:serine/threonine protein kinase
MQTHEKKELLEAESPIGTPLYIAPEMLIEKRFNYKIDIFCFGYMLFELISNNQIYNGNFLSNKKGEFDFSTNGSINAFYDYKKNGHFIPRMVSVIKNPIMENGLLKIAKLCLTLDVNKRPNIDIVIEEFYNLINGKYIS